MAGVTAFLEIFYCLMTFGSVVRYISSSLSSFYFTLVDLRSRPPLCCRRAPQVAGQITKMISKVIPKQISKLFSNILARQYRI